MIKFTFTQRAVNEINATTPFKQGDEIGFQAEKEEWSGAVPDIGDVITYRPLDPLFFEVSGRQFRYGGDQIEIQILLDLLRES